MKKTIPFYSKYPRIAFFIESQWAFGSIHTYLIKELYKKDIDADLIDWNSTYSQEDWKSFNQIYDTFVTVTCSSISVLLNFGIPYEKIIAISHGYYDIFFLEKKHLDNLHKMKKIGAINKNLKPYIEEMNTNVNVTVLQNGINFDRFYNNIPNNLSSIGYAGTFNSTEKDHYIENWKRGYLAERLCNDTDIKFVRNSSLHYLAMPNFYSQVDSIIVSSTEIEACGLPLMECAAAGRLPISANVGITTNFNYPPGIILPIEEENFIKNGIDIISDLKSNPQKFKQKCKEAQEFAYTYYDWSYVIDDWIKFLVY
jgi:glycosyltransferase involved in cell wall biosynthesis